MPWTSRTTIDARREFVLLAQSPDANIRALCRRFNVSPPTAYKVLNRFRAMGEKGLQDLSRRPLRTPAKTPESIEQAVLSVRATNPLWGGRKIARELRSQGMTKVPAPSTITNLLSRRGLLYSNKQLDALEWITASPRGTPTLPQGLALSEQPDMSIVLDHLLSKRVLERRRAVVILSKWRGLRPSVVCNLLRLAPSTYRRCLRVFSEGGAAALFARRKNPHRKYDNGAIKDALFEILHQPPSNFGINRTTWKMEDLSRVLKQKGKPAGEDVVREIIKSAGYRWRKARVVLTSSDPEFSDKVSRIQGILANLAQDEAFFSIDEYGPFAIKDQPGRSLVAHPRRAGNKIWGKVRVPPEFSQSNNCKDPRLG